MRNKNLLIICFILVLYVCGCSKVPLTNRNQLTLLPESVMVEMGLTNYRAFLDTMPLSTDVVHTQQLNNVGSRISTAVDKYLTNNGMSDRLQYFNWEYHLVEANIVNAWCMPGGKICFYTGILPYTQNEPGMATVMGHEVAHAVARHGNERMTQQLLISAGGVALSVFMKNEPELTQNIFLMAYSIGTEVGLSLPYSRKHETEADELGLIFMAMAGYNPQEAVNFWKRMSESGGSSLPEFLSTHPDDNTRIKNLEEFLPEAMKYYEEYQ